MTLSNLTYSAYLRSLNIPSDASHVLDHYTGDYEEIPGHFALVHNDDDLDGWAAQDHARASLYCYADSVDSFIRAKGDKALPYLIALGFSEYEAACKCWNAGIRTEFIIRSMNRSI